MVAVVFNLVDQDATPLEGITVRVYDADNEALEDTQVTDAAGDATFDLPTGIHWARFYPAQPQSTITSPQRFTVIAVGSNNFDIVGRSFERPTSPYSHMCTLSGFFVDASGMPQQGLVIRIDTRWTPTSIGPPAAQSAPLGYHGTPLTLVTDTNGYVQTDLVRGATVNIVMSGYEDQPVTVEVPDADYVDFVDFLFPQAVSLTFDPLGPLAMAVGDTQLLNPQLLLSNRVTLDKDTDSLPAEFLTFASSDTSVVTVALDSGEVRVTAVGAGAAAITATVQDDVFPVRLPIPVFTVTPVAVVVA